MITGTRRVLGLAIAAAAAVTAGCSLIGLGIGASQDAKEPDQYVVPGWQITTLERGETIGVVLEGERLEGRYRGTEFLAADVYAEKYARARSDSRLFTSLPSPGERVELAGERKDGTVDTLSCRLDGFDYGLVWYRESPTDTLRSIPLIRIRTIVGESGDRLDGAAIRTAVSGRKIPHRSGLVLQVEKGATRVVPLDEILHVTIDNAKHGALTGFLVGLAVDAAVVVAVAAAAASAQPTQSTAECNNSCPFVYSFDGETHRLDTETFGGALFRAAQRTDFDTLDHLREIDGEYRLRLTNELRETQYVDALELVVVDHPAGTEIVPSFEGELRVLGSSVSPTSAVTAGGEDVLSLVRSTDGTAWISNPFGRDATRPADARDVLELTFPRPPGTSSVKLALNVRNTLWASYLQGHLLELVGTGLEAWYGLMNSSAEARDELRAAMIREGMLLTKVRDGDSWRTEGFVWEVGPTVARDRVVEIDLRDIPGEELRIRLESTPGLWVVDRVCVDYTPDAPVRTTEVEIAAATDQLGRDVGELLRTVDDLHYVMPTREDRAELVFAAPPKSPGLERSVVLVSTGYYEIHVAGRGRPQVELVERLLREPGAYGRFTLRLLEDRLRTVGTTGGGA